MMACAASAVIDTSIVIIIVIFLGTLVMTYQVARQSHFSGQGFCIFAHLAMLGWLASAILEMSATTKDCKVMFALMAWPFIAALPTVWAFFLHAYAFGRDRKLTGRDWAALIGGPLVITLIAFTNPWHGLLYGPQTTMLQIDGRLSVQYEHGPFFYLAAGYLYLFLGAAIGVGISGMWFANPAYRGHFGVLIAITAFPISGNLAYVFGRVTVLGFDPTPFMFALVLFLFTWMMTITRPFELSTIGRDLLFFTTRDPAIMIDTSGRVMTTNTAARRIFAQANIALQHGQPLPAQTPITPLLRSVVADAPPPQPTRLALMGRTYAAQILAVNRPLARKAPPMGWLLSLTDISDVLTLKDELRSERDFLTRVLETDLSGMLAFGHDGRIVFANAEAERLLGVGPGQCINRRYDDESWGIRALDGSNIPDDELPIAQILRMNTSLRDVRLSIRRPDGERRAISLNVTPLQIAGHPARVVCSIVDITDQLATESALRDAVTRAQAANAAKSAFLANMSHEIRTPLTGVLGMADLLAETELTAGQKPMIDTIRLSGWSLLSLINDILDLARVEAGKLTLDQRPFSLSTFMQQLNALHIASARAKDLEFSVSCQDGDGLPRIGDITRVMQIMQNLIGNAIKFTERGKVKVHVDATDPEFVEFSVSDTGIGMTPEQSIRVFQEFEQAESGTSRRFGGTGLGLAIVQRLVDMMDGAISVKSVIDEGTEITFRLHLPVFRETIAPRAQVAPPDQETETTNVSLAGRRVLVADDTATNRMVMQIMLQQLGIEAAFAENGLQACELWRAQQFDLIILDISMPVMDGMDALKTILQEASKTGRTPPRIIAATANVMKEQTDTYLHAGFTQVLPKPINKQKLAKALRAALG